MIEKAIAWVPRGSAARFPTKYDVDENELARISKLAKLHLDEAKDELETAKTTDKDEAGREGDSATEDNNAQIKESSG